MLRKPFLAIYACAALLAVSGCSLGGGDEPLLRRLLVAIDVQEQLDDGRPLVGKHALPLRPTGDEDGDAVTRLQSEADEPGPQAVDLVLFALDRTVGGLLRPL